jgi:uncharacterized protein (TIGR03435 family)
MPELLQTVSKAVSRGRLLVKRFLPLAALLALSGAVHPRVHAQAAQGGQATPTSAPLEFDVASIKRNPAGRLGMSESRTLPDGSVVLTNATIGSMVPGAAPVQVLPRNVIGLPDWTRSEGYDITLKPAPGATLDDRRKMMQTLFVKRMKLVGHIEERETRTYSLMIARSDGRLGPALKKSELDCAAAASQPQTPLPPESSPAEFASRCGMRGSYGSIVSGGMLIDNLARNIQGRIGGPVANKTGLEGYYAFTLHFAEQGPPAAGTAPGVATNPGDDPDFFTALQEQLGLKLLSDKGPVPYFIVEHIERPTEN